MRTRLVAISLLAVASGASARPMITGASSEIASRILAVHNAERAKVGAPPLEWDTTLAEHAASYGPVLASLRSLVHSPRAGRPGERENLAMAWHGTMSADQMVGMWSAEQRFLEAGSALFPGRSRTGRWEDIAHYTQMIWPTTTKVGCAVFAADWDYLICRYSPPGNIDGRPIFVAAGSSRAAP